MNCFVLYSQPELLSDDFHPSFQVIAMLDQEHQRRRRREIWRGQNSGL
jgi:hypothetical protein